MNSVTLSEEAFNQLQKNTFHYIYSLLEEERSKPTFGWMTNKEVMRLLGVSSRQLQNWRDSGQIGFSQTGKKIYYSHEGINKMLQDHYHKPFKAVA